MKTTQTLFLSSIIFCGAVSAGSAQVSDPDIFADSIPQQWDYSSEFTSADESYISWWKQFSDPTLNALIELCVKNNQNISIAARRMDMAKDNITKAKSEFYPSANINAGYTKQRASGAMMNGNGHASSTSFYQLGASMSWEIDLFGKIRAGVNGAKAQYSASRAEYDGVMVAMAAELSANYFQLRMYQNELAIAQEQADEQERTLKITKARMEAGLGNGLEVAQSKTQLYATQATIPQLENSIAATLNTIATLTGLFPHEIKSLISDSSQLPEYRRIIGVGVPMNLLRRRPDLVEAEMQISVYAAQLGIARKDYLPTLSLNGSIGTEAHNIGDLFKDNSFTYTIAPTLTWTIFDGFARKANSASARRQMEIGIDNYNQALITAVAEVQNAMTSYKTSVRRISLLENCVEQSKKSLTLSLDLYKQGLAAFTNVIDAQSSLLQYQNELTECKAQALISLTDLYKALGGGFNN